MINVTNLKRARLFVSLADLVDELETEILPLMAHCGHDGEELFQLIDKDLIPVLRWFLDRVRVQVNQ
jgi:hypothetical protein